MKGNWIHFHFEPWHFGIAFISLVVLTNIAAQIVLEKDVPTEKKLSDVQYITLKDNISSGTNFVLFYKTELKSCSIMEQNLLHIANTTSNNNNVKYIKIDTEKYKNVYDDYNITGVPSILIFKGGKETNRITGIVSQSNMEHIYKRTTSQNQ